MSTQSGVVPVHNAMVPTSNGLMVPSALMTSGHNVISAEGGGIFQDNTPFSQVHFTVVKNNRTTIVCLYLKNLYLIFFCRKALEFCNLHYSSMICVVMLAGRVCNE